jgi:hypothetical protein
MRSSMFNTQFTELWCRSANWLADWGVNIPVNMWEHFRLTGFVAYNHRLRTNWDRTRVNLSSRLVRLCSNVYQFAILAFEVGLLGKRSDPHSEWFFRPWRFLLFCVLNSPRIKRYKYPKNHCAFLHILTIISAAINHKSLSTQSRQYWN